MESNRTGASEAELQRIRDVYTRRTTTPEVLQRDDFSRAGNRLMVQEARETLVRLVQMHLEKPLTSCRILDVGCGDGSLLGWLHEKQGVPAGQLVGVDLMPNRVVQARASYPNLNFIEGNAEHLDFSDGSQDLVAVFTVFSSVLDTKVAANLARDIYRVLSPGGAVLWYDMRYPNPWNPDLRAIGRGKIHRLFPQFIAYLRTVTLLPPLARAVGDVNEAIYPALARIPFLRSHLVGLLVKR